MDNTFSYGIWIQNAVSPVLELFTKPGFAPLLATAMVVFAASFEGWMYFRYILPGRKSLLNVRNAAQQIKDQENFRTNFADIDDVFQSTPLLRHGWTEFQETLIKPAQDDPVQVIRNTVVPDLYLKSEDVLTSLRLKRIHFVSNLLVGIGLLLTFLGLVAALTEAGKAIGAGGTDFQEPIKKLLGVAAFKFWTSVSGLGCSIILRIFYEGHYNGIKRILRDINAGLERGLQFVTPESLSIEHLREAKEQSAAMRRFTTDLAVSLAEKIQTGFSQALSPVHDSLKDIGDRITGGIGDAIKDSAGSEMQQIALNMGGIAASLNASRAEMEGVSALFRITMTEAGEALKAASGEASGEMSRQLQDVVATLTEESRKQAQIFDETMKRLSNAMEQAGAAAGGTVQAAATNLASGMTGVSDGVRDAAGTMAERMTHLSSTMQAIEERMSKHVQTMEELTRQTKDTEHAMGETSRHLSAATQPMTQATQRIATTAEQLNLSVQGVQKAFEESHKNISAVAAKMQETQATLQNAWQSYDRRFAGVDDSLGRALQEIVNHTQSSLREMGDFVKGVDMHLAKTVQTLADAIQDMSETEDGFSDAAEKLLKASETITAGRG